MEAVFLKLVNMSITAGWLILAVLLLRLVFKKAPKWVFCLLWGLVAIRLICPFSIKSVLSLIPSSEPLPEQFLYSAEPQTNIGIESIDTALDPIVSSVLTPDGLTSVNPTQVWSLVISRIWLVGLILMLSYGALSYFLLIRKLRTATKLKANIRQTDRVDSPFVLGLIRPVIYLPYSLNASDMEYVLAHEQAHIKRLDHWWKPLGFAILSVYWFNPVIWVAYILLCRDIEAACDERVIHTMQEQQRKAYSTALLNCSIHRRTIAACPLAFGEVGVKGRIKSVMNYNKPAFWIIIIAIIACITVTVCFLTDPAGERPFENVTTDAFVYVNVTRMPPDETTEVTDLDGLVECLRNVTVYKQDDSYKEYNGQSITYTFVLGNGAKTNISVISPFIIINGTGYRAKAGSCRALSDFAQQAFMKELEEQLMGMVSTIAGNANAAASSNPYDYIEASQDVYNQLLAYGDETVECFAALLRTSKEDGLKEYIMAAACADITGIGLKEGEYDPSWWGNSKQWLALYDSTEKNTAVPVVIATECIDGQQAQLQSFGYSTDSVIACGIAPWQGSYGTRHTLVLDGEMGQNQIDLNAVGAVCTRYCIYMPNGIIYDNGTRDLYSSLMHRVTGSEDGITLIAPFHTGEYFYELELYWEEMNLTVTYGLKLVMTGETSSYDKALDVLGDEYWKHDPLYSARFVERFTLANAAISEEYYLFEINSPTIGTKRVAVSVDEQYMFEVPLEE